MDVTEAVGCVMALATCGQPICLAGMTALEQKGDEVLASPLLPLGGLSEVQIFPTTWCLQSLKEEITHSRAFHHCPNLLLLCSVDMEENTLRIVCFLMFSELKVLY